MGGKELHYQSRYCPLSNYYRLCSSLSRLRYSLLCYFKVGHEKMKWNCFFVPQTPLQNHRNLELEGTYGQFS